MSKLDELIAEMCPDGVQSKKISELCCISRGIVISKEDISNNVGDYPVYSSQTENTLTCYGTLSIANVCRVRNITHRHLSFLLKSDFPLAYHLGFAIDDNPLALLSNPMFHCLCQKCGGSPRGLSCYRKSLIIRTFNNSRF